ncbi:MAG TPA: extracellular solute-binding protein [Aggregatilineaceae bacterium]|nr:extracellular solute-binding protein [Aggregatilineaceae bacterium]
MPHLPCTHSACILKIILITTLLLASGCAGSNASRSPAPPTPTSTPAAPQPLLVWHSLSGADRDTFDQIRLNFEVANPSIDVQWEFIDEAALLDKYESAVMAGAGPDLLFGPASWVPLLKTQGLIQPIGQSAFDVLTTNLSESVAHAAYIDGVPYGVAYSAEFDTLYFNRTVVQTPPFAFDDLLRQAANVRLLIPPTFGATSGLYLTAGGQLMDEAAHTFVAQSGLEDYLSQLKTLASSEGVTFTPDQKAFQQGQAGLLIASSADYPALKAALGANLGIASLPLLTPDPWQTLITVQPVMQNLNSTAEAIQAASLFVRFLTTSSTQRDWFEQTGHTPVNPAELADGDLSMAWGQTLEWGVAAPLSEQFQTVMLPALDAAVQAVTLEGKEPAATAADVVAALQRDLGTP